MSQIERLAFIDERIKEKGGFTAREVARRFEVGERQVGRDIEYLRYRLGAPVTWKAAARRYEYSEPWNGLEFADEQTLLFYVLARAAAGTVAYVPIVEERALAKLAELVPASLRRAEAAIRYELPGYESADIDTLCLLLRGLADGRLLDIEYRDAEGRGSQRRVEVERLVNYAGNWYCVAFDQEKGELRTFRLSRVRRVALSRDKAPSSVDQGEIERFLAASFGMFKGAGDKRAVIRFFGRALAVVRDEVWHPAQDRSEGDDPSRGPYLQLSIPVSGWDEILGRVLRFGADAEPTDPPEFKKLWKAEIWRMAAALDDRVEARSGASTLSQL
jgi:predicted DNA-binding transcriptional regulator YafY